MVKGAREHNLKGIDVTFPLGVLVAVTGRLGLGQVQPGQRHPLHDAGQRAEPRAQVPGRHRTITGLEHLDKVVHVDQSPIGRTPRSNPATYTGVWDHVRKLFASTTEAKMRGYLPGRFSFNVKGGRCEACSGDGTLKIEMNFLPDVYVPCEVCKGARFNRETLEVHYKGKTVAEVLNMPIEEAADFFAAIPAIARYLRTLTEVGLGYVRLGQPATTLSGGEAQRVKLASELQKRSNGRSIYVLDEPTTGLHFEDIRKLLLVLQGLVDKGNSVIVIEHNLDVIKSADWLIDMGPEGGFRGGTVVAEGPPEFVATVPESHTGRYLAQILDPDAVAAAAAPKKRAPQEGQLTARGLTVRPGTGRPGRTPVAGEDALMTTSSGELHVLQTRRRVARALPPVAARRRRPGRPSSWCTAPRSTPAGTAGWPPRSPAAGFGRLRDGPPRARPDGGGHRHRPVRRRLGVDTRAGRRPGAAPGDRRRAPRRPAGAARPLDGLDHRAGQRGAGRRRPRRPGAVRADRGGPAPRRQRHRARGGGRRRRGRPRRSTRSAPFNERFEPARTRYDWLSRDPAEVDAYVADPLCGDEMPLTVRLRGRRLRPGRPGGDPGGGRRAARRAAGAAALRAARPGRRRRRRAGDRARRSCSPSAGCRWSSTSTPRPGTRSSTRPTATRSSPTCWPGSISAWAQLAR